MLLSISKKPRNPGCFGYGCLIATVLLTISLGGIFYYAVHSMRAAVHRYTAESALSLSVEPVPENVALDASKRFEHMHSVLSAGDEFSGEFSEDDVRGVIQNSSWKNKVDFHLITDQFSLKFAIPLVALGDWEAASFIAGDISSRALNGFVVGRLIVIDGKPDLLFSELKLNSYQLEDLARKEAAKYVLGGILSAAAKTEGTGASESTNLSSDPLNAADIIKRVKQFRVENGRLLIKVERRQ